MPPRDLPDVFSWFAEHDRTSATLWLILGKGPSFAKRESFDLTQYRLLSLNHAVRELPVDLAHLIDIDVVDAVGEALLTNAGAVVMPWHPHQDQAYCHTTLAEWAERKPILARLRDEGRLLWYNLIGTGAAARPGSPEVLVKYFSGEAAVNLLATAGVRTIRSLGVDGGTRYSGTFKDLAGSTLLANGRSSFDKQFDRIAKIILTTGVDFAPLDVEAPIRVYVACTESELVPVKVLEYSLMKHTSMTVTVTPLYQTGIAVPVPMDPRNHARTPFSFQRFLIPQAAGRRGLGVYLDADMQVFQDFRELWTTPMDQAEILAVDEPIETGRQPQFSVMLLDCERLPWSIDEIIGRLDRGELTYERLMYEMAAGGRVTRTLPAKWNRLERYVEGDTGLVHYTDMETQPWVYADHPFGYLWCRDLLEAVKTGFTSAAFVREHVERGHVRPSLLYQIEHGIDDPVLLPARALALDRGFRAPYTKLGAVTRNPAKKLKALLRHWYHGSLAQRVHRRLSEPR